MRLAKFLAAGGVASRRAAEDLIRAGRVTVGGETITDPARDVTERDDVACDGRAVSPATELVVYAVNKPAGVVSTASDPQRRPTVVSLVNTPLRLYPVGRLDIDATGLILLTNDGELAHRLMHPSFEVERTYRAVVGGPPISQATLRALRAGVRLEDGMTAPARARRIAPHTLELILHEGRKRQVKRMCEHVGHPVRSLSRVAIGPLTLGGLADGAHRRLGAAEIAALTRAGGDGAAGATGRGAPTGAGALTSAGSAGRRGAATSRSAPPPPRRGRRAAGRPKRASGS